MNRDLFPPITNLYVPPLKENPAKQKSNKKPPTKNNLKHKKQPKEIVFSTIIHFWHLLQTFSSHSEIFLLLILLTVNGFDYSLFMFYFFTQSSAVIKRKRWI